VADEGSISRVKSQPIKVSLEINHNYNVALRAVRDGQLEGNGQLFETMGLENSLRTSTSMESSGLPSSSSVSQNRPFARKAVHHPSFEGDGPGIYLASLRITCTVAEIPDPPPWSLREDPKLLIDYWEGTVGLGLYIHGISIPMKNWREVYAYNRPEVWKKSKQQWSCVRVSIHLLTIELSFLGRYIY
jgi:hypothetical protein